jgi:hypothetical protein
VFIDAPWMGITEYEEAEIRSIMREKTAARRARQEQQKDVTGNLYLDSQAQELSGTGLSYKIIDGQVELEWATKSETDTKGFIVKRRAAKTNDYSVIASYKDWGPLASKGVDGGIYRYLDVSMMCCCIDLNGLVLENVTKLTHSLILTGICYSWRMGVPHH